jgi:exonuclease SbcC
MRLLRIRGRNLASLQDDFTIDFEAPPLAHAGILAITGPTGAGKSTLLDAAHRRRRCPRGDPRPRPQ